MNSNKTGDAPSLKTLCGGAAFAPGDEGYEAARQPFQANAPQRPDLVVHPTDAEQVADVVRAARAHGLRVAPQGTGHNAMPLGEASNTILVRTAGLNEVHVDPSTKIARAGAGALIEKVVDAAAEHGLTVLHGSSPDVSVGGYSLGGGLGWQGRKHGLQCNAITAVELVDAQGELLRVTSDENPDLFWALRGGLGNFGVVTALEFQLFELATAYAGAFVWPAERAHEVLSEWTRWSLTAPDEVTTAFRVLNLPELPGVPPFAAGRRIVLLDGAVLGDESFGADVIAPLRALGPELDLFEQIPAPALLRIHGDPEEPTPSYTNSATLGEIPAEGVDAWVDATCGPSAGELPLLAEMRQLGGALSRVPKDAGAVSHLPGEFMTYNAGIPLEPEMEGPLHDLIGAIDGAMEPWKTGRAILNFVETATDVSSGYDKETYDRLRQIRERVDPDGVICSNHVIG